MAREPITSFVRVAEPIEAIRECMGPVRPGAAPGVVWQDGFLARDTVVYESGQIAREGDTVRHRVDPDELARCRTLAAATGAIDPTYHPGSEGEFQWDDFFIAANVDDPIPGRIDERLIRERFGGTILPVAPIAIEPIREESPWWTNTAGSIFNLCDSTAWVAKVSHEVWWERSMSVARALDARNLKMYGETGENQTEVDRIVQVLAPDGDRVSDTEKSTARDILALLRLIRFYRGPEFRDAAYVTIGIDSNNGWDFKDRWPPGLKSWPCCFPCLVLGLTQAGSLTGLMGYTVNT